MALGRAGTASLVALAAALVVGVVLGLVLEFGGSSEPDPWEERWADLGVSEAEFVFLGNFTGEEQKSIRRELKVAQVVFDEHFGAVTSDFTAYVSTDVDALNERLSQDAGPRVWFTCGGLAHRNAIAIVLEDCSPEWRALGGPLAHEYFHILQSVAGAFTTAEGSFRWLTEGSAVYASALVADAAGRRPLTVRRQHSRLRWSSLGKLSAYSWDPYDVGFLATDWLVEQAGPKAVLEFFRLGGHRVAFESAFGMTLSEFRAALDLHRLEVAPPFEWRVEGTVLGPDGAPTEAMHVFAIVRTEVEAWPMAGDEADEEGRFEFAAPGGGYTLGVWLQCPRGDGVEGDWVYTGEWGADGFVADADGFVETGDEAAEPFAGGEGDRVGIIIELPETRESLIAEHCRR